MKPKKGEVTPFVRPPQMRKYVVYMDDGRNVFKVSVPAISEEDAIDFVSGNGEVVAVKDVTSDYTISTCDVHQALENAGFPEDKCDWICRALSRIDMTGES